MKDNKKANGKIFNDPMKVGKEITLESIREKAFKMIPEDLGEVELEGLLELAKKVRNLSIEDRKRLLDGYEDMTVEEIKEILNRKKN